MTLKTRDIDRNFVPADDNSVQLLFHPTAVYHTVEPRKSKSSAPSVSFERYHYFHDTPIMLECVEHCFCSKILRKIREEKSCQNLFAVFAVICCSCYIRP
ncbi:hypothetical protein A2U01_0060461, partial [Trifolium medium]|nr:hypothetical protein [Trifolium medium]